MDIVIVTTSRTAALARLTARSTPAPGPDLLVLDLDGSYRPVGGERVLMPADVAIGTAELHGWAVRYADDAVRSLAAQRLVTDRAARGDGDVVVLVEPGVLLLATPDDLVAAAAEHGLALVARSAVPPDDGRHPTVAEVLRAGGFAPGLLALRPDRPDVLTVWAAAAETTDGCGTGWLVGALATVPHTVLRDPATLVSAWSLAPEHVVRSVGGQLRLDERPVVALDLTELDPTRPWLLGGSPAGDPRARLSDHPALAAVVAEVAEQVAADRVPAAVPRDDLDRTSMGAPVDPALRSLYRADGAAIAPDPFDPAHRAAVLDWLTEPSGTGAPGRYLLAVRDLRPDLRASFPWVPGRDEEALVTWAADHAAAEGFDRDLVAECVRRWTPPPLPPARYEPGVNVVGFLRGELGIGESARLLLGALASAGVPHVPVPVETHLASRQRPGTAGRTARTAPLATTVVCVNSDLTPAVTASLPVAFDRTYRIGMWYWEVEEFPATQHGGLSAVDEVWVATDFIRRAVEPHTALPVRTLTPPLPQRPPGGPRLSRADLDLPEGPLFLFAFDFLSTAERKNPLGLVEAFCAAFGPQDGPVLVVKSINADQRPADAERLRLRVAGLPHVLLMEDYLDADARDALMAACDCYVSLHRSEGLGLTMAEAMAWGKPVIATRYSGNLEFMTDENSYLVDWSPVPIPADAAPYPPGSTWAEPDLAHAARLLRRVIEHPEEAAARGARAAQDIASVHSPAAAGRRIAARLAEIAELTAPEGASASRGRRALDRLRGARA